MELPKLHCTWDEDGNDDAKEGRRILLGIKSKAAIAGDTLFFKPAHLLNL